MFFNDKDCPLIVITANTGHSTVYGKQIPGFPNVIVLFPYTQIGSTLRVQFRNGEMQSRTKILMFFKGSPRIVRYFHALVVVLVGEQISEV